MQTKPAQQFITKIVHYFEHPANVEQALDLVSIYEATGWKLEGCKLVG